MNQTPVLMLWTGGWDSTFHLLQLLFEHRLPVVPIYLVDPTRKSSLIELETMDRIREALTQAHPETRALLHPTEMVRVADLAPDPTVQDAFDRMALRYGIGSQYAWLARFAKQRGLQDMEMSSERARHGASGVLMDCTVPAQSAHGYPTFRVAPDTADPDIGVVFGAFAFPMIGTTREDMTQVVKRNGWGELMGMTWFCHRPTRNAQPCGLCNPCRYVIDEGFGWRIPPARRRLSAVYRATVLPLRTRARRWLLRWRARGATA
ncbi:hypothetical protein AB4059_04125 [Lysobacter sp. 2RAF19]